jgi:hypothetical protein
LTTETAGTETKGTPAAEEQIATVGNFNESRDTRISREASNSVSVTNLNF